MGGTDPDAIHDVEVAARRSKLPHAIRQYFYEQNVLEVTTPTLGFCGVTDPNIQNLKLDLPGQPGYLQTSPEYAMKRLLAAGSGSIYQICPAYRGGEKGRKHRTEFTMLEWYRLDYSLVDLMSDVEGLIQALSEQLKNDVFSSLPFKRISYRELFVSSFGINPHQASEEELVELTKNLRIDCRHIPEHEDSGRVSDYLDLLFSMVVEPELRSPTLVYDFPSCQVALAQLGNEREDLVARRFELFASGVELANGYLELGDPRELEARMVANNQQRQDRGLAEVELDQELLSALPGMPACSGVAMGIDRLFMTMLGKQNLADVLGVLDS